MKHFYPEFYKNFKCIADKCPDSCCKDWDVVVDDESQAFYETVSGSFGEKLKSLTTIDEDGDRIFVPQNGRCPFWNSSSLCDIYINLGENRLCATCRSFPRISQDYTAFCEHMLSFACPEAARIMLESHESFTFETAVSTEENVSYNAEAMNFLLQTRKITFEIFGNENLNFSFRLKQALAFNDKIQDMLDNENFNIDEIPRLQTDFVKSDKKDCTFIFNLHSRLDIMSKSWRKDLEESAKSALGRQIPESFDKDFTVLAKYYIFRYYLTAIDSFDVLGSIKRIVLAYTVCGHMTAANKNADISQVMQRYSKEIEHSYENSELLYEEFCFNPNFSTENLIVNC